MLRFEVTTEDLLRSRFALSPAFELCSLLQVLEGRKARHLHSAWAARLLPTFQRLRRETDLNAALALHTDRFGADFVAMPPTSPAQTWQDDLAVIRATALAEARRQIAECLAAQPVHDPQVMRVLDGEDVVDRVAAAMNQAWHELLAPDWPRLRSLGHSGPRLAPPSLRCSLASPPERFRRISCPPQLNVVYWNTRRRPPPAERMDERHGRDT